MKLIISKYYGFCYGITKAVDTINEMLEKTKPLYCLGEPAHNETVLNELRSKGLIIIDDINTAKEHIIFRAHGVTEETYTQAKNNNITITDLTCPKVLKVHEIADENKKQNYYIFLLGKKGHPEVLGTKSFCGENSTIIESNEDINEAIEELKNTKIKKLLILNQTTFNIGKRKEIIELIKTKLINIEIKEIDTTCKATDSRQKEAIEISKEVDLLIVVGGKKSHNTKELYEITKNNCDVIIIETIKDLNIEKTKKHQNIGITSGASTSKKIVEEIIKEISDKNE